MCLATLLPFQVACRFVLGSSGVLAALVQAGSLGWLLAAAEHHGRDHTSSGDPVCQAPVPSYKENRRMF